YNKIKPLIPLIAGGLALEQSGGAMIVKSESGLCYSPVATRSQLIDVLVSNDVKDSGVDSLSYKKKRTRYYQANWNRIHVHIETIRLILLRYDKIAQKRFKEALAIQM
ncbi:hypothetical protein EAY46_26570, partial [Vibrio anguillarum]|nr:hypothetical protein [Vibrio anguillarum]